jgi:transcription initiation factor TFIID subunit 11
MSEPRKRGRPAAARRILDNPPENDYEEEEEDDDVEMFGSLNQSAKESGNAELEIQKMKLLLANFNDEQMSRYEAFRRANINRSAVKKLSNSVLNQSITANVAVALSGMSKVFVGEIVEKAREVQKRADPPEYTADGKEIVRPLAPEHLREAWRLFKLESGTVPQSQWRRQGGADGLMFR